MTKIILIASFLLMSFFANAQEFQGKAEYFSKRIVKIKKEKAVSDPKDGMDSQTRIAFEEAMKKATEKQYALTFNKKECIYEQQEQLEKPENPAEGDIAFVVSFSGEGKKYINIKEQKMIVEDEIFGKEFLIVETLVKPDWKLINETKKIGEYNCFKAELVVPVSEKQKQIYQDYLKREERKPGLFKMEEPVDIVITAWYTPEIPISFGPNNQWGLPGLILEINDTVNIILCTKVTLSNKEKTKIKAPNSGDKVTQKQFDEIQKKKADSMKNEDGVIIFEH